MRSEGWAAGYMMRRIIAGAAAVAIACGGEAGQALAADVPVKSIVQSIDQLWNISYNTEVRYFSWQNTRGFPTNAAP
jgi:ABC-type oligopeptide transport system substrate-binding subunit